MQAIEQVLLRQSCYASLLPQRHARTLPSSGEYCEEGLSPSQQQQKVGDRLEGKFVSTVFVRFLDYLIFSSFRPFIWGRGEVRKRKRRGALDTSSVPNIAVLPSTRQYHTLTSAAGFCYLVPSELVGDQIAATLYCVFF